MIWVIDRVDTRFKITLDSILRLPSSFIRKTARSFIIKSCKPLANVSHTLWCDTYWHNCTYHQKKYMRVFNAGGRLRTMYPVYDSIIKWRKKVLMMIHCADDWIKMATDDGRKEDGVLCFFNHLWCSLLDLR